MHTYRKILRMHDSNFREYLHIKSAGSNLMVWFINCWPDRLSCLSFFPNLFFYPCIYAALLSMKLSCLCPFFVAK